MTTPVHARYPSACYAVICRDIPGSAQKRKAATPDHLRHIESIIDEVNAAGPLFDDDGQRAIGSLLVYRTQSAERARELAMMDPYFEAGVWASIEVLPFFPAAGIYVGGKNW